MGWRGDGPKRPEDQGSGPETWRGMQLARTDDACGEASIIGRYPGGRAALAHRQTGADHEKVRGWTASGEGGPEARERNGWRRERERETGKCIGR